MSPTYSVFQYCYRRHLVVQFSGFAAAARLGPQSPFLAGKPFRQVVDEDIGYPFLFAAFRGKSIKVVVSKIPKEPWLWNGLPLSTKRSTWTAKLARTPTPSS